MSDRDLSRTQPPRVVTTAAELRAAVAAARAAGKSIGLVPTMGALHAGHLTLARASSAECGYTVVTVFVNPTQFGPREDFGKYPRTLDADLAALAGTGADLVFAPASDEMYPGDFSTYVDPPRAAQRWEGERRPGHFRGVATVCLKLFNLARADVAFFGHKDYQQSLVIRRLVADLNVPITIRVCPTVREADGLALSSRNRYLNAKQREQAVALWRSLQRAAELVRQGQRHAETVQQEMGRVLREAGVSRIDYVALVDPETLEPLTEIAGPVIALIVAYVGDTRLIDNLRLI
ncbi:MAG: pantoate--beta-alanine ligase [Planctomycetota bacterium]|nr:pantoate--beta-alanine ligase [Planctomycetota bacterium]